MNILIKYLQHLPALELVFFRSFGALIFGLIWINRVGVPIKGNNQKILILRGIVGVTSMALYFRAIQLMPVGSAISLRYLAPFFAAGLAIVILGERMKGIQWFYFVLAFAGILLLKGFDPRITMTGLIIILISALFSGMVFVIIRKIGHSEHPAVVVNYFMTVASIVGGVGCLFQWVTPEGKEWLIVGSVGIVGFAAQYLMTRGFQYAETNLIVPFKYSEVVFTVIAGWLLLGEYQTWQALVGIAIIIFALVGNFLTRNESLRKKVVSK
ncbi:MAG: DMT family transporter [Saprospiraceae bacterium]|nr:DMT family transporter [Saprospiraceae bacterium]